MYITTSRARTNLHAYRFAHSETVNLDRNFRRIRSYQLRHLRPAHQRGSMMDGSYFALGLIGLLLGWIVGDFQRELRFRREARANLDLANRRTGTGSHTNTDANPDGGTGSRADSYSDGPAHYVNTQRRDARRRAVRGDNVRSGPVSASAGRYLRSADAPPVMAGGWDFDGD